MTPTETTENLSLSLFQQMNRRLELIETDARRFNEERAAQIEDATRQLDERLSGRMVQLDEKLFAQIRQLDEKLSAQIRQLDEKFSGQIRQLDGRIDRLEERIGRVEERMDRLDHKIDQQGEVLSARMDRLDHKIDRHFYWMIGISLTGGLAVLGLLVRILSQIS